MDFYRLFNYFSNMQKASEFLHKSKIGIPTLDAITSYCDFLGAIVELSPAGRIEEILFSTREYTLSFHEILGQSIYNLYDIPPDKPLQTLGHTLYKKEAALVPERYLFDADACRSRNIFEKFDKLFGYYSKIPYSLLHFWNIKDYGLWGIIRFNSFIRRTHYYRHTPLFHVNTHGILKGFNKCFFNLFSFKSITPEDLLDKPVDNFISPAPDKTINKSEDYFNAILSKQGWGPHYKNNGWRWKPGQKALGLLPLDKPVDFSRNNIKIEIELALDKNGRIPVSLLIGGEKWDKFSFPDKNGYLIGYDSDRKIFIIKKGGEIIQSAAPRPAFEPGKHRITVFKCDNDIALFINDSFIVGYHDPEPDESIAGFQYLYSESGTPIDIKSLSLDISERVKSTPPTYECSLPDRPQSRFRFTQIADTRVTLINNVFHYAFLLTDISRYIRNIELLKKENKKAVTERDRFREMALKTEDDKSEAIGSSPLFRKIKENALTAAASHVTILIEGETGTGKEVLAKYIHAHGLNPDGRFIKVDCSTLPATLIESE